MDLPISAPPDLGDLGAATPLIQACNEPIPLRSLSPPPPPRKNASGLPPAYLALLRGLIHQWLGQQLRHVHEGGSHERRTDGPERLWSPQRVTEIEAAVWSALEISPAGGKTSLLELDWKGWVVASMRRQKRWGDEQGVMQAKGPGGNGTRDCSALTSTGLSKTSTPVSVTPAPTLSRASSTAPARNTSRPPSVLSNHTGRQPTTHPLRTPSRQTTTESQCNSSDSETAVAAFYQALTRLRGFQRLSSKDEWDLMEDRVPTTTHESRDFPGAFPQTGEFGATLPEGSMRLNGDRTPAKVAIDPDDLVKPIFCAHFPRAEGGASSSTLHLRRRSSILGHARTDSMGSASGRWWSGSGSGRNWSSLGFGPGAMDDAPVAIEFVENRFALPSANLSSSPAKRRRRSSQGEAAANEESVSDDDETSSAWSGTQRAVSTSEDSRSSNLIISGDVNDLPSAGSESSEISIVGGTFVIRGIYRDDQREALKNVLRHVIYAIEVITIELELMDAFRVPRELDPPPVPSKSINAQRQKSTPGPDRPSSPSLRRNTSLRDRGEKAKGFFHRLGRDTRGMFGGLMSKSKLDSPRPVDSPSPPLSPTVSLEPPASGTETPATGALPSTPHISQTTDRHLQTLSHLQTHIMSTTPNLSYPMPPLLLRVKEEDRIRVEKAQQEAADESKVGLYLPPNSDHALKGRAKGYRMGGDVRAGLCALTPGLDTFEGWSKLQRISTLVSRGISRSEDREVQAPVMCERPHTQTYVFWGDGDQSVLDFLHGLGEEGLVCGRPECDQDEEGHTTWWFHADRRLALGIRRVEEGMGDVGVDSWIRCTDCKKTSVPRQLGDVARLYSWGKFLELLLYSTVLLPSDFCPHSIANPSSITYNLRTPHLVATISVETISILDTRLPKLQVGPNVTKRKAGKVGVAGMVDALSKKETREKSVDTLADDIEKSFQACRRQIEQLSHLSPSDQDRSSADDAEDIVKTHVIPAENRVSVLLAQIPSGQLNTVRTALRTDFAEIKQTIWKRAGDMGVELEPFSKDDLPGYVLDEKILLLPGSSSVVRVQEPSSIMAYTLSSMAYFTELAGAVKSSPNLEDSPIAKNGTENESWQIEVTRKDSPRDLLSLRAITKKRSDASIASNVHRLPMALTPNQPSLELSLEQVESKSINSDRLADIVKNISKATAQDPLLSLKSRSPSISEFEAPSTLSKLAPSMLRRTSDATRAPPSAFRPTRSVSSTVPSTPSLPAPTLGNISGATTPRSITPSMDGSKDGKEGWSSVTSTFTSSLTSLMRMGSDMGSIRVKGTDRSLSSLVGPLSMMSAMDTSLGSGQTDELPHIQFNYTLPDKLKLSCTVYYASAFDSLRRRCAIDRGVIESLSRCEIWDAQGGKSKASFFMTKDKRFIVKELVSKWNVSDTQALLEIAPSYFEYLASTHNKATSLAKIVGFYTVKIHDIQANSKKSMDLLVMENLFHKQTIAQTYDLKGIEGRKVPKTSTDGATLFDGEWIEGQSRSPILLYPHAKRILQDAIANDTRFLCAQSIMDYSLLLGLDNAKKELVVGVVDAIGSYNLFKTIESRGKLALTRGGDVTVIPPDQYRDRFETALKQYFIACPDKWSRVPRKGPISDQGLPTIL